MNLLVKQTESSQVPSSPAYFLPYGETHPETWEWLQGVGKGRQGEQGSSVSCEDLTPSPWSWPREGELHVELPDEFLPKK